MMLPEIDRLQYRQTAAENKVEPQYGKRVIEGRGEVDPRIE